MTKIHPPEITDNTFKVGRLNLPTVTLVVLVSCIVSMSLMAIQHNPIGNFFHAALFLLCPTASILGFTTLIWCFAKRKQFAGEDNKKHFREAVIIGVTAFTSPIWIVTLFVMIFGFLR